MGVDPCAVPPSAWYCYLLACADGTFYAGITTELARRLAQHNRGVASRCTRARRPVRLVYAEPHPDRSSATRRERELKVLPRAAKEALARGSDACVALLDAQR